MTRGCPALPTDPDGLDRREAAALRDHLDACAGCRRAWIAAEPSRLFAALADDPIPDAVLEAVSIGVARAIAIERRRGARAWTSVAAIALAAVLGAGLLRLPERAAVSDRFAVAGFAATERAAVRLTAPDEGVRMVDLTVGDRQLVMIFDERMPL